MLHFAEMCLAMQVGMLIFILAAGVIPEPAAIGMALFMAAPMVAWMRIRGHGWRHGIDVAAAMIVPWAVVLALFAVGSANVMPWLAQADGPAMYLGMLAIMLVRRDHYMHGGAHQHAPTRSPRRFHLHLRRVPLGIAYFTAVVLVPIAVGVVHVGSTARRVGPSTREPQL